MRRTHAQSDFPRIRAKESLEGRREEEPVTNDELLLGAILLTKSRLYEARPKLTS
jgi:hypothetical protein